jgi:aminoglycoside phosphotransferase (APT) family kinase protein
VIRVQRLPPSPRPTRLQEIVRELVNGGAAVELHVAGSGGEARDRVLDAVVRAAGGSADRPRVRPSGDGSARVRLILGDGRPAELRVARLGGLKHPARGHEALVALAAAGAALVPRPIGSGEIAGAAWTTETVLQGRLAARLTPAIAQDLVRFTVQLRTEGRPRSIGQNVAGLAEAFPRHADVLRRTAVAAEGWGANLPAVLLHGDLWLGNLLVDGGRLSGVVDWDTWHPAGVAGTDLLNVVAMVERRRRPRDVGPLWLEEIWSSPAFADVAGAYWRALGLAAPDRAARAVIGLDWWANSVVGAARRGRGAWRDPAWVGRNVDDVAAGLEMLLAEVGGA